MSVLVVSCSVYGCNNSTLTTNDPAIQYYFFPKHHVIAQQWINACIWRTDQLDIDTARVCSVHFDVDSYTNEYKKSDYLSSYYTKVLKYDAIPTLQLPYQSIIKTTGIPENIQLQTDTTSELKPIIVFNISDSTDHAYTTYEAGIIDAHTGNASQEIKFIEQTAPPEEVVQIVSNPDVNLREYASVPQENLEALNHIKTYSDFVNLQNENTRLENELKDLEKHVATLKEASNKKLEAYLKKDSDVNKLKRQYNSLVRKTLTLSEKKQLLAKVFSESQIKILSGKKKIYWSNDDMAIGYTIRHMSNKRCYMYLSKTLNIPLPALSSIKRWATMKKSDNDKNDAKEDEKFEDSE